MVRYNTPCFSLDPASVSYVFGKIACYKILAPYLLFTEREQQGRDGGGGGGWSYSWFYSRRIDFRGEFARFKITFRDALSININFLQFCVRIEEWKLLYQRTQPYPAMFQRGSGEVLKHLVLVKAPGYQYLAHCVGLLIEYGRPRMFWGGQVTV